MAKLKSIAELDVAPPAESSVRDYVSLLKPRVMSLVVFSGIVGLYLAPGHIHPFIACIAILCIAVGSGAAGAINMWYERDLDQKMERTKNRPIPAGRIEAPDALHFGVILACFSVLTMSLVVNLMSCFLLTTAILFYVFIYTVALKTRTPQNIVIGGAAGAFPPMIGYAAVNGSISLESLILFAIIFFWTPPHFWALALYKSGDYAKAGIPMMPVVRGDQHTKLQMLIYTGILTITTLLPVIFRSSGLVYLLCCLALNLKFIHYAVTLYYDPQNKAAPAMFGYSIIYLFLLLTAMVIDRLLHYTIL